MANSLTPSTNRLPEPKRARLSNKLKAALADMVWNGASFDEAAHAANFNISAMRKALNRRHVLRYLKQQKMVFLESVAAANIHRAREIRDQTENQMAAIKAIQVIEQIGDVDPVRGNVGEPTLPGLVIRIINTRGDAATIGSVIEHEPREDE
jgi:hypothetical protein